MHSGLLSPNAAALTSGGPSQKPVVMPRHPLPEQRFHRLLHSHKGTLIKPFDRTKNQTWIDFLNCSQVKPMWSMAPGWKFSTKIQLRGSAFPLPLCLPLFWYLINRTFVTVKHGEVKRIDIRNSRSWWRVTSPTPGRSILMTSRQTRPAFEYKMGQIAHRWNQNFNSLKWSWHSNTY